MSGVTVRRSTLGVVDCDIHPTVTRDERPQPVSDRAVEASICASMAAVSARPSPAPARYPRYNRDGGARLDARPPDGVPAGSDLPFMREQHLDPNASITACCSRCARWRSGCAIRRSANRSQPPSTNGRSAPGCGSDGRLKGSLDVDARRPGIGAARDRPARRRSAISSKSRCCRTAIEPLGRQRYWPIYEAAEALGKPIGIHVGGISGMAPTSAGWSLLLCRGASLQLRGDAGARDQPGPRRRVRAVSEVAHRAGRRRLRLGAVAVLAA